MTVSKNRKRKRGEIELAGVGTPIRTASSGKVVYAGEMLVSGININLTHGNGWHSRYLHLSKLLVQAGQLVKKSEIIGYSGATGREAPHLQWEIVWRGIPADPNHFLPMWERFFDPKLSEFFLPTESQRVGLPASATFQDRNLAPANGPTF